MSVNPSVVTVLRWTARVWSLLVLPVVLLIALSPDLHATVPVALIDWILLSLFAVATIGLLLAWRWEALGGIVVVASVLVQNVGFGIVHGFGLVPQFFAIAGLSFLVPAGLFLLCWAQSRGKRGRSNGQGDDEACARRS